MGKRTAKNQRRERRDRRRMERLVRARSDRVADAVLAAAAGREVLLGEELDDAAWERVRRGEAVWLRHDGQGQAILIDQGPEAVAAARATPGSEPALRRVV